MCIVEIMTVVSLSFLKIVACNKSASALSVRKAGRAPQRARTLCLYDINVYLLDSKIDVMFFEKSI